MTLLAYDLWPLTQQPLAFALISQCWWTVNIFGNNKVHQIINEHLSEAPQNKQIVISESHPIFSVSNHLLVKTTHQTWSKSYWSSTFWFWVFLNSTAHSLPDTGHTHSRGLVRPVYFVPVCFRQRKWGAEEVCGWRNAALYQMNPNHSFRAQANGGHLWHFDLPHNLLKCSHTRWLSISFRYELRWGTLQKSQR